MDINNEEQNEIEIDLRELFFIKKDIGILSLYRF